MNVQTWALGNGQSLEFTVFNPNATKWHAVAGLYIFTYLYTGKDGKLYWHPLYIGQTDDFSSRMPGHERFTEAVRRGATHIHAVGVSYSTYRDAWEKQMIQYHKPIMNEQYNRLSNLAA